MQPPSDDHPLPNLQLIVNEAAQFGHDYSGSDVEPDEPMSVDGRTPNSDVALRRSDRVRMPELQLGNAYRSDLNPHNYRAAAFFVPDSSRGEIQFQVDFPVWAIAVILHNMSNDGLNIVRPNGKILLQPYNVTGYSSFWLNLPISTNSLRLVYLNNTTVDGGGWDIIAYDRWIPSLSSPNMY